ncbi:MAG: hypothetical protein ABI967_09505 [bacterium]
MSRSFCRLATVLVMLWLCGWSAARGQNDQVQRGENGIGHSSWDVAIEPAERKKMLALWDAIGEDSKTETCG